MGSGIGERTALWFVTPPTMCIWGAGTLKRLGKVCGRQGTPWLFTARGPLQSQAALSDSLFLRQNTPESQLNRETVFQEMDKRFG